MFHRTLLLISLLLVIGAPSGWSGDSATLSADTSWQRVDEKSGITLFSRSRPGTPLKEFRGTGLINAPPAAVEKVIQDVEAYPRFMPFVLEARVIAATGSGVITYQRLEFPFIANRDYTVRVDRGTVPGPNGKVAYRDTWETDNEDGPAERPGVVRVKVNEGSWLLEPAGPDGASTQVTYQIFTDSGGAIPAFLANRACQTVIPKVIDAVRKEAADSRYKP